MLLFCKTYTKYSIMECNINNTLHTTQQSEGFIHTLHNRKKKKKKKEDSYIILVIIQEIPGRRQTEKQLGDAKENGRGKNDSYS